MVDDVVVTCATCEIEVTWSPVERDGVRYCCGGCADGGPCCCSYDPPTAVAPDEQRDAATLGQLGCSP